MRTSPDPTPLQAAAQALLRRHGAMTLDELVDRLRDDGFDLGSDPVGFLDEELLELDELDELPDGRQLDLASTVDGAVATSLVTAEEIATGVVQLEPDLELLVLPDSNEFPLPDGRAAEIRLSEADLDAGEPGEWLLSGPAGWLDHLAAGEHAAFRITGGTLHVEPADTLADDKAAITALGAGFDQQSENGEPIETGRLLLAVLVDHPHVLREPLPPLTELLAAAGLETYGDWVGEEGTQWGAVSDEPFDYGLDADGREALGLVLGGYEVSMREGPDELAARPDLVAALAACLSVDGVVEAFASEILGVGVDAELAAVTAGWSTVLAEGAPSEPGPHHVLAACAERLGDADVGEDHLQAALRADPTFGPALLDLAWYAEDRGDAARALSLLRRAGVSDDDPQVERLERYAAPGPAAAGRNEPCPCGSARKYKVCCAQRNGHPLHARVPWLLAKAMEFVQRPAHRDVVAEVAIARAGGDPNDPSWVEAALGDPLVIDLALFEEDTLACFCDERGPLLPADELALARSWLGLRSSLYEVSGTPADSELELRDVATGEHTGVSDASAGHDLEAGELLFARLLPVGEQHLFAPGVLRIPFTLRDRLLAFLDTDPDGVTIAAWFAAAEKPPELHNTDGDPLMACTATFEAADERAAATALDAFLERTDDHWTHGEDRDGQRVLLGTVALADGVLEVHTNSERRLETLVDLVTGAVDGLELVDEERIPAAELAGSDHAMPAPGTGAVDEAAMAEALDVYMQEAERRWVDESVPALGGLTPRQAADDPTRRGDLERLLAEFDADTDGLPTDMGTFDVGRLRRLLGL